MALRPGQMLSHYRLVEKIGEGGMGVVWRADDKVLNRPVAIKVLHAGSAIDDARRERLLREARLASSVRHAQVVQLHEVGREREIEFIVMELVEGRPLSQILHGRPLPARQVAGYGQQIAEAVAHAHRKGLLHRDLKPGNLLLTAEDEVKVADFGLATLFDQLEPSPAADASTRTLPEHTERKIAGTLPYMSPEQVRGERLDSRSDIFSLGVILYEMTTGLRPFQGATAAELAADIQRARPRAVHEVVTRVPFDLDRTIHKALAARPSERYQTMDDLAVDLRRLTRDLDSGSSPSYSDIAPPARARRQWTTVAAALGAVAVIAIATALYLRPVTRPPPVSPPVHRQLTFTGRARAPEISPDGQFVAYVEGGSLAWRCWPAIMTGALRSGPFRSPAVERRRSSTT